MILLNERKYNIFCEKDRINFNITKKIDKLKELVKEYENTINFEYMKCPTCDCDELIYYGGYERNIGINDEFIPITIKRVQCKNCKKTHAIIPTFIKAYHVFESSFIDFMIVLLKIREKKKREIERLLNLSRQLLRKWEKRFNDHENYIRTTFGTIKLKDTIYRVFKEEFNLKYQEYNRVRYFSKIYQHNNFLLKICL